MAIVISLSDDMGRAVCKTTDSMGCKDASEFV